MVQAVVGQEHVAPRSELQFPDFESKEEKTSHSYYLQLGDYLYKAGVYNEAILNYQKALQHSLAQANKNTTTTLLRFKIGEAHLALRNYNFALNSLNQTLKSVEGTADEVNVRILIGTCHEKLGQLPLALIEQMAALELAKTYNNKLATAKALESIGSVYEDMNLFKEAKNYFNKALISMPKNNLALEANILNNLADAYRKSGAIQEALPFTIKALQLAKCVNDKHQIESAHKDLAIAYKELGNYKLAYQHLNASDSLNDKIFYAQNTEQINALQSLHEANKKEIEISSLKQENKLVRAKQAVFVVLLIAIILLAVGFVFYWNKKRRQNAKLVQYKQRMLKAELDKKIAEEENMQKEIKLKAMALSRYSLHLSQKNKILATVSTKLSHISERKHINASAKLKKLVSEIDFNLKQEEEWNQFQIYFNDIHPGFTSELIKKAASKLSASELRLAMLVRLNLSSKEIATILRVTPDSIRVARYRLRKKLPIASEQDLIHYLLQY